jgi:hypothetical protein
MFTSQKNSTCLERRIAPIGAGILNTSYIIIAGLLLKAAAQLSATATVTMAAP